MFSTWLRAHRARLVVLPLLSSAAALAKRGRALSEEEHHPDNNNEKEEVDEGVYGISSYNANDPIEDRSDVQRLEVLGGWWFALFDGHRWVVLLIYIYKLLRCVVWMLFQFSFSLVFYYILVCAI
jgi:hypothetical protein